MIGIIARINVYDTKKLITNVQNTLKNAPSTTAPVGINCVTLLNHCACRQSVLYAAI